MIDALKDALTSKKFLATILGAVLAAVGSALGLDEATVTKMTGRVSAYLVGQGLADQGKSAAIVSAASADVSAAVADADTPKARADALDDLK